MSRSAAADLDRFKRAQDGRYAGFASALTELRRDAKRGHWIWYVFPQLSGLGFSSNSQAFGISGVAEAEEYLRDAVLRSRLLTVTEAVAERVRGTTSVSLNTLMGSRIDAKKVVSSLTLFEHVARKLYAAEGLEAYASLATAAEAVLEVAAAEGYPRCRYTLNHLGSPAI